MEGDRIPGQQGGRSSEKTRPEESTGKGGRILVRSKCRSLVEYLPDQSVEYRYAGHIISPDRDGPGSKNNFKSIE